MQRGKQVPWAGIIFVVILLNIFTDLDFPILPLIIGAVVFSMVTGSRRARPVGRGGAGQQQSAPAPGPPSQEDGSGLPRIDVPPYPGEAPPPPLPGQPSSRTSEPPPWRQGAGAEPPQPEPGPPLGPPSGTPLQSASGAPSDGTAYPSSTSTDPVVSLGQLNLGRLARELDSATRTGATGDVARVLREIDDVVQRSQSMMRGATGSPDSGRKEFEAGLRRLEREVSAARDEQPPGQRVERVVRTCTVMGQTGRYE